MFKRVILFLLLNFLVVMTISIVLSLFSIRPYLNAHGIDYSSLLAFCFIWGMGGAVISLLLSRWMARFAAGVRLIDPKTIDPQEKHLLELVYQLARKVGISKMPQVGIFPARELNAFATGPSKNRSLVAVSSGLLEKMDEEELKAVLGHEISHIANGDMVTMTLLQGVVNAFVLFLSRVLAFALSGMGKNRGESSRGNAMSFYLFSYLFEIVFMILGSLLVCAYSRYREFRADAGGASLVSKQAMIGALQTLESYQKIRDPKTEASPIAAFKISHPSRKGLFHLFATHPPIEERIARLQKNF